MQRDPSNKPALSDRGRDRDADLAFATAADLLARLGAGEVSSRELVELYLRRIEAENPSIGAVVTLEPERALGEAAAADAERRAGRSRPLLGLPVTVKDSFAVAGMRTTCGVVAWADLVPAEDAPAVARLRGAGAIVLGKTNVPAFLADLQTSNELFGTTVNPWSPERTCGGSSGGSAAAIAAGLSALELGSDLSGSIRVPASFCGVYGHRPSSGLISKLGHLPWPLEGLLEPEFSVVGPIARAAEDLRLALDVLAAPYGPGAEHWRLELAPPRHDRLGDYRIGILLDGGALPVDEEVAGALERALAALSSSGAEVVEVRPPFPLAEGYELFVAFSEAEITRAIGDEDYRAALAAEHSYHPPSGKRSPLAARAVRHRDWLASAERREQVRAAWGSVFSDVDVLVCPATPTTAIAHDHRPVVERTITIAGQAHPFEMLSGWSSIASLARLPATTVPAGVGTNSGLPVGIQIVGPYLGDRTTIAVAELLAGVLGGFAPPPGRV